MTAAEERAFVLQTFMDSMEPYKDKKIALYGLGVNSEYLVMHQSGYHIIALMDPNRIGEVCWGLPIISAEDASEQVDVVVIVAKYESVPIIYDRISWLEKKGIIVTDIGAGKLSSDDEQLSEHPYWEQSMEDLLLQIDNHEVITFDIFDTLLMRAIAKPTDIFEVVARIWEEQCTGCGLQFAGLRKEAEQIAGQRYGIFHYEQIYEIMAEISNYTKEQLQELSKIEYDTERRFLSTRKDVVEALEYACEQGKEVYLISDMYYSAEQLEGFLKENGVAGYRGIMVSSDVGCCKWPEGALFTSAIEQYNLAGKSVLHIGDNEGADVQSAQKVGWDTYHVWSAYHMIEKSTLRRLLVNMRTLEDSCMLGIYMEHFLNSPFALHEKKGLLYLKTEYDVGFAGYGALLTAFIHWLIGKHIGKKNEKILFLARDGYLLEKMYEQVLRAKNITNAPKGQYVLASRRALATPAMFTSKDLEEDIEKTNIAGIAGDLLKMRFGVIPREDDELATVHLSGKEMQKYIKGYTDAILVRAEKERKDYIAYLKEQGIYQSSERHILVDSQTAGTSAHCWRKMIQKDAMMDAVLLLNVTNYSLYDEKYDSGFLGIDYKIMPKRVYNKTMGLNDCILTSPEAQFLCMEGAKQIYSDREQKDWEIISFAQSGVIDFAKKYIQNVNYSIKLQELNADFLDDMLRVLWERIMIKESVKKSFVQVEEFVDSVGKVYAFQS